MYKEKLIPIADLITPNTFEAEWVPYLLFAWLSIFNYYSMFLIYFVQKTDWNYNRDWRRCNEGMQCFSNSWLILDFVTGNRQAALLWTKDGIPYQYAAWDKTWCACNSRQEPEGYEYVELHILKPACIVVCMLCYILLVKYNCVNRWICSSWNAENSSPVYWDRGHVLCPTVSLELWAVAGMPVFLCTWFYHSILFPIIYCRLPVRKQSA